MPLSVPQLVARLAASGLLTAEDVRGFVAQLPADRQPRDAQDLARELVRRKWLTEYQAREVFHGRTKGLVYGEYRVLEQIATGGMGQVYKAEHRRMERVVALKVLKESLLESPLAVERFRREVRAAARLDHPNIVAAYDAGEIDGSHFLVLQYVDGPNLKGLVRDSGPLALPAALDYLVQAALGLEYAHAQGVLHRDIKPANLLLDRKGLVKLLDMGLARIEDELREERRTGAEPGRLTVSNQMLGTSDYMSPEQAEDTRTADARSDQYALGCTFYYLLVGKPPYPGDTVAQTLQQHLHAPVPALRAARSEVPQGIDAIYQRMLAKRPQERYASMTEVIEALSAAGVAQVNPLAARASRPMSVSVPVPVSAAGPSEGEGSGSGVGDAARGEPSPTEAAAGGSGLEAEHRTGGTSVAPIEDTTAIGGESGGERGGSGASITDETVVYLRQQGPSADDVGALQAMPHGASAERGWWRRWWSRLRP